MIYYIVKILVSAVLITIISEISKRSSFWGGVLASVPLVSVLAFIWLYFDTKSSAKIISLSYSIFWLVIPSLSLFLILPQLLNTGMNFFAALCISIVAMTIFYYLMIFLLERFGIRI
jgi:hypothetical protein